MTISYSSMDTFSKIAHLLFMVKTLYFIKSISTPFPFPGLKGGLSISTPRRSAIHCCVYQHRLLLNLYRSWRSGVINYIANFQLKRKNLFLWVFSCFVVVQSLQCCTVYTSNTEDIWKWSNSPLSWKGTKEKTRTNKSYQFHLKFIRWIASYPSKNYWKLWLYLYSKWYWWWYIFQRTFCRRISQENERKTFYWYSWGCFLARARNFTMKPVLFIENPWNLIHLIFRLLAIKTNLSHVSKMMTLSKALIRSSLTNTKSRFHI